MNRLIFFLMALVFAESGMAQNSDSRLTPGVVPVSVGKQTIIAPSNPQIIQQAVPYSEADRIIKDYPGYHTAVENKPPDVAPASNTKTVVSVTNSATATPPAASSQKNGAVKKVGAAEKQVTKKAEVTNTAQPIE